MPGENEKTIDFLIIGAGPAGLQLGYYLQKNHHDYLILEATDQIGSFFAKYPRSGTLISFNKVHNIYDDPEIRLRWDWNSLLTDDYSFLFKNYSKRLYPENWELRKYLEDFAANYDIAIQFKTRITQICKDDDDTFLLQDNDGCRYRTRCLIIASGFGREFVPDIPGIEYVTETYGNVSMDPHEFLGQRVLILGKGNSAYEIADNILDTAALIHLASPETMRFAWNTRHPGHVRANYMRILDTYQLKLLHGALDCDVVAISPLGEQFVVKVRYAHAEDEEEELIYDRVVRCTGFQFDTSIFDKSCKPALSFNDRLPALTSTWESANVPGMFFAGTLMQARDFKKAGSAFIDGFRYNIRTLYRLLCRRYHDTSLSYQSISNDIDAICQALLYRVCRTSALWTQFGYLCDLLVVAEDGAELRYYEELPVDYVRKDAQFFPRAHFYTITFEWGPWCGDVFAIERQPSHQTAYTNAFLHPIIRRYNDRELISEHHILEDLFGMYSFAGAANVYQTRSGRPVRQYHADEHEQPLRKFFEMQLGVGQSSAGSPDLPPPADAGGSPLSR